MQYYEPEYAPPVKKKKAAATTTRKKVAKQATPVPKPKQKPATVAAKKAVTTTTAAKTAPAAAKTVAVASATSSTDGQPKVAKEGLATASLTKPAEPAKPLLAKPAASSAAMTCDKATGIVSGYGFASVTPKTCSGDTFAFNASRGGKSYEIKLSAATGELTEVKKLR
jgi:outer membrane biosynthesis protein TonB